MLNDGKQEIFRQLHGWIYACLESKSPRRAAAQVSALMAHLFETAH